MTVFNPPNTSSQKGSDAFWTFAAVEERLIDALDLWRRSPGGGKWPFAGDAPWQWMTRRTRIEEGGFKGREYQLRMQQEDGEEGKAQEGRARKGALTREEIARRDEATEWLRWAAEDARKVVIEALKQLAQGRTNIDWRRVKGALGAEVQVKGLYRRYTRAIYGIAKRLNAEIAKSCP